MPNNYQIGQVAQVSAVFTTAAGALADPTTVTLKLSDPTGATTTDTYPTGSVTKDGTGAYHKNITLTKAGPWTYRFEGTGALVAANEGVLEVVNSVFY